MNVDYEELYKNIMVKLKALERNVNSDVPYFTGFKEDLLCLRETIDALDSLVRNKVNAVYCALKKLPAERAHAYDACGIWTEQAGIRLRTAREELGLSIEEAVKGVDVTMMTLNDWERGFRSPQFTKLLHYVERYKINLNWVLTGTGRAFEFADFMDICQSPEQKLKEILRKQEEQRRKHDARLGITKGR